MTRRKNLVICESGAKAKSIMMFLNSSNRLKDRGEFRVMASRGHIEDLKGGEIAVDVDNGWIPTYQPLEDKKTVIAELKKAISDSDTIWLAGDADREGEAICESLRRVFKIKSYHRITYNEITMKALENAILNPRQIDSCLVDAQFTRRVLDRVVGFKLSPLLWKKFKSGGITLSAGRVQSALLHLIISRENEIKKHIPESYWHFVGNFSLKREQNTLACSNSTTSLELEDVSLFRDKSLLKYYDITETSNFLQNLTDRWKITDVNTRVTTQAPPQPFVTSTMQQESYNKLGLSIKRTMQIAQELYENGLITYHRTDSYAMSDDFKSLAKQYIISKYNENYWSGGRPSKNRIKASQEAHECIRICKVDLETAVNSTVESPKASDEKYSVDYQKLYQLIRSRSLAYLMTPCQYDELTVKIGNKNFPKDYAFIKTVKKIKFPGYLEIYKHDQLVRDQNGDCLDLFNSRDILLRKCNCLKIDAKNTFTNPPSRFNESSCVKLMETTGIGRPSSYAGIVTKLLDKRYIIKTDIEGEKYKTHHFRLQNGNIEGYTDFNLIGSEKTRYLPTNIGYEVDNYIDNDFSYIVDSNFTSLMEADLDKIAKGEKHYLNVLNTFYTRFGHDVENNVKSIGSHAKTRLKTSEKIITVNGMEYIVRLAQYGPVIQWCPEPEKKKFINLKTYLKIKKFEYTDINESDVNFLINLPKKIATYEDQDVIVENGKYGFYLKINGKNIGLSNKSMAKFVNTGSLNSEDIVQSVEYNSSHKSKRG